PHRGDLAKRAAPAPVPPLDELCDRPAVPVRECGHRDRPRPPAAGAPVPPGTVFGYLLGKPVGILGVSLLVTRLSRGRLRPPVGWAAVLGAGTVAGGGVPLSPLVGTLA